MTTQSMLVALLSQSCGMQRRCDGQLGITSETTEKAMAPHSSTLAWKIPWTEEPGGLLSMGSLRLGRD